MAVLSNNIEVKFMSTNTGDQSSAQPSFKVSDKTVFKSMSLGGVLGGGTPCAIDVKDGKVVRVRPLHYDEIRPDEILAV